MASNHTPNYGLSQWERSDKVQMEDFNADNTKIDAALGALGTALNGKASASALDGLSRTVSQQASALGGKGNCILYSTTHTGTGEYGKDHPSSLTFPHRPMVVFLTTGRYILTLIRDAPMALCDSQGGGNGMVTVTWSERSVQWYSIDNSYTQMNVGTCSVVALLDAEH